MSCTGIGRLSTRRKRRHTRRFLAERERMLESTQVDFLEFRDGKNPMTAEAARHRA